MRPYASPAAGRHRECPSRTRSRECLVTALHPDGEACQRLLHDHAERLDWDWLLDRASVHKVSALLAARVRDSGAGSRLPTRVQCRLDVSLVQAEHRTARAEWTLQRIGAAFAERGLRVLVIKGSVLAELVYGDPSLRPFFDVDIVVPPETLHAAEEALRDLGYGFAPARVGSLLSAGVRLPGALDDLVPEDVVRGVMRRVSQHFCFAPPDGRLLPVELHWQVRQSFPRRAGLAPYRSSPRQRAAFFEGYAQRRSMEAFMAHKAFWTVLAKIEVASEARESA